VFHFSIGFPPIVSDFGWLWGVFSAFYTCSAGAIVANCLFLQYYCRFPSMPKAKSGIEFLGRGQQAPLHQLGSLWERCELPSGALTTEIFSTIFSTLQNSLS